MLYDSTKTLLQSILRVLETGDESRWDGQVESGNACLYEMHQMSGRLYKAYKTDVRNANSVAQSSLPEKLDRAIPHVRAMVIAIRHKERDKALESCRAALAEMNGTPVVPAVAPPVEAVPATPAPKAAPRKAKPAVRPREMAARRRPANRVGMASGK